MDRNYSVKLRRKAFLVLTFAVGFVGMVGSLSATDFMDVTDTALPTNTPTPTGGNPICIGLVGVNFAANYTGYEGEKAWPTDGKKHKHPIQEAEEAVRRLMSRAAPSFDEFQALPFRATNAVPFPFEWVDYDRTAKEYSALLVRVSREYDRRF